jgi:disulfide bond formation protein DsbB
MKKILFTLHFSSLLIIAAGLGVALYLQHGYAMAAYSPCALCVLQRYIYVGIGFALVCAFIPKCYSFILKTIVVPLSLLSISVALYHIWILHHPSITCGREILEEKLNNLAFAQWLPQVFEASGFCFEKNQPVFGLSLPVWSLLAACMILSLSAVQLVQIKKRMSRIFGER